MRRNPKIMTRYRAANTEPEISKVQKTFLLSLFAFTAYNPHYNHYRSGDTSMIVEIPLR